MANPIWGLLAKSLTDNETIEEAIARLIAVHEADEESHLGAGESLQSHKASVIIDHLASSVVQDKIALYQISPDQMADMGAWMRVSLPFESLDAWYTSISAGGSIVCDLGNVSFTTHTDANDLASMYSKYLWPYASKDLYFRANGKVLFPGSVKENLIAHLGFGDVHNITGTANALYFKISGGHIFACHITTNGAAGTEYTTEIQHVASNTLYQFLIKYTAGIKIEYFINGVLVYTRTTNLPNQSYQFKDDFRFSIQTTDAFAKNMVINAAYVAFKM